MKTSAFVIALFLGESEAVNIRQLSLAGPAKPFFKGGPVNELVPATITSPQNGQPHAGTPTMVHYDVGPLPAGMNALQQ